LQVQNLFKLDFIKKKANVIFLGGVGLGKTHLTTALAYDACLQCRGPWYIPTLEGIRAKVIPHPWDHGNSPPGPGLFPSPLP